MIESLDLHALTDASPEDDAYVPGAGSIPPPRSFAPLDFQSISQRLVEATTREDSALAKSRALCIAALLRSSDGDTESALQLLHEATLTSPRLVLCAELFEKQAMEAGRASYERLQPELGRAWEACVRQSQDDVCREHAQLRLLAHLERGDRQDDARALLDRLVRSGEGGVALELKRIVQRLSQAQTLSGVAPPQDMAKDVTLASEIVSTRPSSASNEQLASWGEVGRDVLVQRASQELKQGHVAESIAALEQSGLPGEIVVEFAAALHGSAPGGLQERIRLLWKLVRANGGRRVLRSLLFTAVLASDRATIASALDQVDPTSGTLELKERLFLSAFAGQTWQGARQDLAQLFQQDPVTALALVSPLESALVPSAASSDALLIQLGAALAAPRPKDGTRDVTAPHLTPARQRLLTALDQLEQRGEAPLLCAAARLDLLRESGDRQGLIDSLCALSDATHLDSAKLMRATLLGSVRSQDTRGAYEELLETTDENFFAAARGLLALDDLTVSQRATLHERLGAASGSIPSDGPLALLTRIESALSTSPRDAVANVLEVLRPAYETSTKRAALNGPLFAALLLLGKEHPAWAGASALLMQERFIGSQLLRLRAIWDGTSLPDEQDADLFCRSQDIGMRAMGAWFSTENRAHGGDLPIDRSSVEFQLDFVNAVLSHDLVQARRALESAVALEDGGDGDLLREILLDTSELELTVHAETANALATTHFGQLAQSTSSETERRFFLERLAEHDERAKAHGNALLLRKALAEEFPEDMGTQFRLEEQQRNLGQSAQATGLKLAELLPPGDRDGYRVHLGLSALYQGDFRSARRLLEPMLDDAQAPMAAVRGLITIAREKRDDVLLQRTYPELLDRQLSVLDQVEVRHELALVHERQSQRSLARGYLAQALELAPWAFPLRMLENYLDPAGPPFERAEQLVAFADACSLPTHKVSILRAAATEFQHAEDWPRAVDCHERVLALEPGDQTAYEALVEIHQRAEDASSLRAVYVRRLSLVRRKSTEQRTLLLELSSLLATVGAWDDAKTHLELLLLDHPDCVDGLRAHARISLRLEDLAAAERTLLALRALLPAGEERIQVARQLGLIYMDHTGQSEKAMGAYESVLSEVPHDPDATTRLVEVYCRLGLAERAAQLQVQLIQSAELAETKRALALRLAQIYETVGRDMEKAAATFDSTRKAWPLDAAVLRASIEFLDRRGDTSSRNITLTRADKDARRRLDEGSLDPSLLETLEAVALLSGRSGEAEACQAARGAYLGHPDSHIKPAGLHSLSPRIDPDLAPRTYPDPLRRLLEKTGDAMDAAFSVDLSGLGARAIFEGLLHDRVQKIAETIGWPRIELYFSDSLGARCLPVSRRPARLVIGPGLDQLSHRARDYLLLRAFKLQVMGVGALSRSREEDRQAAIAALLSMFAPNWRPSQLDMRKVVKARALLEQGLSRVGYDDDVPTLALETIGALGGDIENSLDAPRILAARACLIGVGDLGAVFEAIAAGEGKPLPEAGPARFRFIESQKEARELLLFMTTPAFTRARATLGLISIETARAMPTAQASRMPSPTHTSLPAAPPRRPKPPTRE